MEKIKVDLNDTVLYKNLVCKIVGIEWTDRITLKPTVTLEAIEKISTVRFYKELFNDSQCVYKTESISETPYLISGVDVDSIIPLELTSTRQCKIIELSPRCK